MTRRRLTWTMGGESTSGSVRSLTVDEIDVVFQPIVDLQTRLLIGHEALVRCKRPEFKNPLELFERAVAEEACGRLGRLIREVTFARCAGLPVFINLHPDELTDRWLVRPDDPMYFHDRPIFLEITEAAAISHFDLCVSVLREVRSRVQVYLAIDDFGAGYSNLKRVLDLIKIDGSLTRGLDVNPSQRILVRHLVQLYEELGARVVVEGIETAEELKAVLDMGAHYGQGYLLARPSFPPPSISWPQAVAHV